MSRRLILLAFVVFLDVVSADIVVKVFCPENEKLRNSLLRKRENENFVVECTDTPERVPFPRIPIKDEESSALSKSESEKENGSETESGSGTTSNPTTKLEMQEFSPAPPTIEISSNDKSTPEEPTTNKMNLDRKTIRPATESSLDKVSPSPYNDQSPGGLNQDSIQGKADEQLTRNPMRIFDANSPKDLLDLGWWPIRHRIWKHDSRFIDGNWSFYENGYQNNKCKTSKQIKKNNQCLEEEEAWVGLSELSKWFTDYAKLIFFAKQNGTWYWRVFEEFQVKKTKNKNQYFIEMGGKVWRNWNTTIEDQDIQIRKFNAPAGEECEEKFTIEALRYFKEDQICGGICRECNGTLVTEKSKMKVDETAISRQFRPSESQ